MSYRDLINGVEKINIEKAMESKNKPSQDQIAAYEIYNHAIDNMRCGNEDIAVIKLKKVVAVYPEFSQAVQLLKKITDYENERMKQIQGKNAREAIQKHPLQMKKRTLPELLHISPRILMKIILSAVVVILTVLALILVFSLVSRLQSSEAALQHRYTREDMERANTRIRELESELAAQNQELSQFREEMDLKTEEIRGQLAYSENQVKLYRAKAYYAQGEHQKTIVALEGIDVGLLSADARAVYEEIRTGAYRVVARDLYRLALALFNQRDFQGALDNFLRVLEYDPNFQDKGPCIYNAGRAYYELGRYQESLNSFIYLEQNVPEYRNPAGIMYHSAKAYAALGNTQKAIDLFTRVINEHPGSALVGFARDRRRALQ